MGRTKLLSSFFLSLNISEITFNKIIEFYFTLHKNNNFQNEMRSFALSKIDMRIKVNEMITYISETYRNYYE